jgi:integrase/recombinase XerD
MTDFALWLRANGCGENTIRDRCEHLGVFIRSHPTFPAVNPMHVTAWLGREGYAPATRATYFGHLHSYFDFAIENDILTVNPMGRMRRPKVPKGKPRPLTAEQVDQVMAAAPNANMRAWLTLGLYAGLRAHEIAKIRGEDINEDTIYVLGKGGSRKEIPTHPRVWALAQERPRVGWLFPSRSSVGHVTSLSVSTLTTRLFSS